MKQILFLAIAIVFSLASFSQTGSVSGRVTDTSGKKIMPLATVTVFKAKDTTIVTYRLSNENGEFKIPGLPLDIPLRIMVTYSGFEAYRKDFLLTASHNFQRFDSVMMVSTSKQLDEVMVFAERPPVIIKKDTIEFNASAFKTLPNALVEDLLKKLPGVQVDKDGNIAVNGKAVNRILVDGKTFFGDDPKMATRNLPANAIDKVQVVDDKEEMLRNGDDNINNVGKVINITLKKGVKKGWFGKMYAGAGTDKLYEAGAIANIYRDTLQFSVLGYVNNLNRPGFSFSELMQAGGMERNSSNMNGRSMSIWTNAGGSSLSINGVNFGGSFNYGGIATSRGAGFNMNHAPNTKRSFFLQYFYGDVNIERRTNTTTDQYNSDTIITNNTLLTGDVINKGHNIGTGLRLKPDSVTNILINVNYTIGLADEDRLSDIQSMHNKLGQLSFGDIDQNNVSKSYYYRHNISITKLSRTKAGRRYTVNHNLDINNRFNDNRTESDIRFLYPTSFDSVSAQLRNERIPRTDAAVGFNFSEPLNKKITFRIGARYDYSHLSNNISTFKRNASTLKYDIPNSLLSSEFERASNRFSVNPGVEFKIKKFTITPGFRAALQHIDNDFASLAKPIEQKLNNILPALSVVYKQLNINYNRDISLPSYTYFLPVRDNTNPYFISKGNENLLPPARDNISVNYYFNDPKTNFNASVYMNGGFTKHDIVQSITVDDKGIQTTMPVNADGSSNFYWNFNLYKQYK
ncbi:MAG TPA: outer membrane beta-barrel protein, partial [Chitinophagaceae bacterium]|nr:outer membrane beta-barrel protein [Chitinophagaceae bacterium]